MPANARHIAAARSRREAWVKQGAQGKRRGYWSFERRCGYGAPAAAIFMTACLVCSGPIGVIERTIIVETRQPSTQSRSHKDSASGTGSKSFSAPAEDGGPEPLCHGCAAYHRRWTDDIAARAFSPDYYCAGSAPIISYTAIMVNRPARRCRADELILGTHVAMERADLQHLKPFQRVRLCYQCIFPGPYAAIWPPACAAAVTKLALGITRDRLPLPGVIVR